MTKGLEPVAQSLSYPHRALAPAEPDRSREQEGGRGLGGQHQKENVSTIHNPMIETRQKVSLKDTCQPYGQRWHVSLAIFASLGTVLHCSSLERWQHTGAGEAGVRTQLGHPRTRQKPSRDYNPNASKFRASTITGGTPCGFPTQSTAHMDLLRVYLGVRKKTHPT